MTYLSIMMAAVKDEDRQTYLDHARSMWPQFQKHGALGMAEQWGTDVQDGKLTSFPMAVKLEAGESVVVGWITWPDKQTHDQAWASLETDPALADMSLPFDGKRMIFGGFETILSL